VQDYNRLVSGFNRHSTARLKANHRRGLLRIDDDNVCKPHKECVYTEEKANASG